mgnify:CR=1 FL=1
MRSRLQILASFFGILVNPLKNVRYAYKNPLKTVRSIYDNPLKNVRYNIEYDYKRSGKCLNE